MRIGMIYQGEYPPAERIEKTAKTLAASGHEVILLCNDYRGQQAARERVGALIALRLRPTFRTSAFNRILKFPLFANPVWFLQIFWLVYRYRIDAIHVIDLPLAAAAWAVARLFRIRVNMDMWENYPEALKGWAMLDWKTRVFKNPAVARAVELWLLPRMDHTFVVVDEQKQRLIDDGVSPDRISVLTNAVDIEMFSNAAPGRATPLDEELNIYKLLYVGYITVERGLEDIVRAVGLLRDRMPFIRFYIAGTGSYERRLREIITQEGVDDLVKLIGWVPFKDIQFLLEKSDLCVIPHVNNTFINTTIPNKLFQYMLMAKPVMVSDAKPLARIVRECAGGFIFESGNPHSAAAAIQKAYAARSDNTIGERGRRCVLEKYTWDKVSRALKQVYDGATTSRTPFAAASQD